MGKNSHEVNRISRIVGPRVKLVGAQATEAAFKREAPNAGIIHLATHAFTDRDNYWDSAIFLAKENAANPRDGEDGILYLHEVMNLKLRAALVVLTGCETGLGRLRRGGGLEGMSRAFLAAGVPSVIGTLWPVEDNKVTSSLMTRFYEHLSRGLDKRTALQKAKLDILAEKPDLEPFYWAAPILIGDAQPVKLAEHFRVFWLALMVFTGALVLLFYFSRKYGIFRAVGRGSRN